MDRYSKDYHRHAATEQHDKDWSNVVESNKTSQQQQQPEEEKTSSRKSENQLGQVNL